MSQSSSVWVFFAPFAYPDRQGLVQLLHRMANSLASIGGQKEIIMVSRPAKADQGKRRHDRQPFITAPKLYTSYNQIKKWTAKDLEKLEAKLPEGKLRIFFPYAPSTFGSLFNHSVFNFLKKRKAKGDEISLLFYGTRSSRRKSDPWYSKPLVGFLGKWFEDNRLKALVRISDRVFLLSVSQYRDLDSILPGKTPVYSLPATSNLGIVANPQQATNLRRAFARDWPFVLGTYGSLKDGKTTAFLDAVVPRILKHRQDLLWIFIGRKSELFVQRIKKKHPELALRVQTAGELDETAISAHIQSCDLLFQPYPDGVSTTRTSMMAGLHQKVPIVTTIGPMTEQIWHDSQAAALVPWDHPEVCISKTLELCSNKADREELSKKGKKLYDSSFSAEHQISTLIQQEQVGED